MIAVVNQENQQTSEDVSSSEVESPYGDVSALEINAVEAEPVLAQGRSGMQETPINGVIHAVDLEKSPSESGVHASHYIVAPPKKSRKRLFVGLGLGISVLLVVFGGVLGWYFIVRTPDIEYDKAIAKVDALLVNVEDTEIARAVLRGQGYASSVSTTSARLAADTTPSVDTILSKLKKGQGAAAEYTVNKKTFLGMRAMESDASATVIYNTNEKIIDEYGQSAEALYAAEYVYVAMVKQCFGSDFLMSFYTAETVDEFNAAAKPCATYLAEHESVKHEDVNAVFVPVRQYLLSYIAAGKASFSSQGSMRAANDALDKASQDVKSADSSKLTTAEPSKSPKEQLTSLKTKLEERKKIFFR